MLNAAKIKLLIAEDHQIVREGLKVLLELQEDLEVIGEASNGEEAVRMYNKLLPDVLLLDLKMPGQCGVETIAEIKKDHPNARILILTTFDGDEDIYRSLKAGARGYLLKDTPREKLFEAIRTLHLGQRYITQEIANKLAEFVGESELTERENQILMLMAEGLTNRQIADQFCISEGTVKTHVNHILAKLSVRTRTEAVNVAMRRGLYKLP